ncbi:hypothetical protein F4561_001953 [Lipingzhangella halophila]|uniref:Uncharacterized protein n=1 Tax=Lipingzhangella halophila TaxID=1783352 RepID=A0A7W7RGB4_9ACTN|nr:hypothetical protein [Lipingzhangella halophila]
MTEPRSSAADPAKRADVNELGVMVGVLDRRTIACTPAGACGGDELWRAAARDRRKAGRP